MKYNIDPELKRYCLAMPFAPAILRPARPAMKLMYAATRVPRGVRHRTEYAGNVRLDIFEPQNAACDLPCLLYMHGGGFGYMAAPYHKRLAALYACGSGCRVVCPDYRLTPKYPYPAARDDCNRAFEWIKQNHPGVPVAVGGDSAGAVLASYAVAHAEGMLAFQMLIYPVCSAAGDSDSMKRYNDTPLWNSGCNKTMWELYLPGAKTSDAAPMTAKLPQKIPDTYIELAEFDCLHDEGKEYADRLSRAGASVTLCETAGTFHGYDIAQNAHITHESIARRIDFIKSHFRK